MGTVGIGARRLWGFLAVGGSPGRVAMVGGRVSAAMPGDPAITRPMAARAARFPWQGESGHDRASLKRGADVDQGRGLLSTTAGLVGSGLQQSSEMARSATCDRARRCHSTTVVPSTRALHYLVGALGTLGVEERAQEDNRALPALLCIRICALSCKLVGGDTGRNHWSCHLRHSAVGDTRSPDKSFVMLGG